MEEDGRTLDSLFEEDNNEEVNVVDAEIPVEGEEGANISLEGDGTPEPIPTPTSAPTEQEDNLLSGIDKYLSDYGIVGGMITYEDGSSESFTDMSSEDQYNVLQSLSEDSRPSIEETYNLEESEINLLNDIRSSGKPVEEFINQLIGDSVNKSMAVRDSMSVDYTNMPDDSIYLKWLSDINPEITEQEALETLEAQKENKSLFDKQVVSLRNQFSTNQDIKVKAEKTREDNETYNQIETDRHEIVRVVENIDNIGGAELTDQMKNEVLHSLLEVNDQGDPLIMEELFSDPERLFKAAWFMKYGESYMGNYDKYWMRRESAAYKKGQQDTINGAPNTPQGMSKNNVVPKPGNGGSNVPQHTGANDGIDALWED